MKQNNIHKEALLDEEVTCHNCNQKTKWGNLRMISGYIGCDNLISENKTCFEELSERVLWEKEHDYEAYCLGLINNKGAEKEFI